MSGRSPRLPSWRSGFAHDQERVPSPIVSPVLESNFLVPNATFFVELAFLALAFMLLVVWPAVGAAMRGQWGWLVVIVLFGPFAGLLWFFMGRRPPNRSGAASVQPA
jgi:hypothetical protein